MTKELRLTLAALLVPAAALAAPVTLEQARAQARQVMMQQFPSRARVASAATPQLAYAPQNAQGLTDFYVFNYGTGGGFAIIAGDDRAVPVLGYSDNGSLDSARLPCGLQWLLDTYRQEMQITRQHPGAAQVQEQPLYATSCPPLLTTKWGQAEPYFNLTPAYNDGGNASHCFTGCEATAAAQVLKYHQWPDKGQGSHSYDCLVSGASAATTLSVNFANSAYKWSDMIDDYDEGDAGTAAQQGAVAKLMYDVGVAMQTAYGASGAASSAYRYAALNALFTFFKYDPRMQYLHRNDYSYADWRDLLKAELDAKRPILYEGYERYDRTTGQLYGGHGFILDGYDTNGNFHINWGWDGAANGFFALTSLNPTVYSISYNFNTNQGALLGITPNKDTDWPSSMGICSNFGLANQIEQTALGRNIKLTFKDMRILGSEIYNQVSWIFSLTDETGTKSIMTTSLGGEPSIPSGWQGFPFPWAGIAYFTNGIDYQLSNTLKTGKYRLYLAWSGNGSQVFNNYYSTDSDINYIPFTVIGDTAYFGDNQPELPAPGAKGDVDGNGVVDIDDMNVVINVMLHKAEATPAADVDADGTVDIDDMNAIINVMLHKE